MFTLDNTAGFSPAELTGLNNALDAFIAAGWDEKSASDMLNNAWPRIVWLDAGALRGRAQALCGSRGSRGSRGSLG